MEKVTAIVLGTVKYADRKNIVTLYSRELGRLSVISSAGGSRAGKLRNARLQPLSVIRAEVRLRNGRELQGLGEIAPARVWRNIYFDPARSAIAMFLSEFLGKLLREAQPDPVVWDYVAASLRILDSTTRSVANFHIAFLLGLLPLTGIQPDLRLLESPGLRWFDMREGAAVTSMPVHPDMLGPEETALLPALARMTMTNCHRYKMKGTDRRRCLTKLLQYYSVHYPGLSSLKSLEVLFETFSS